MDEQQCITAFKDLAQRLGIEIRSVPEGPTGYCVIRGEKVFFINRNIVPESLIKIFIRDFRTLNLDSCFVVPVIRELLGREQDGADWESV